VSRKQQGGPDIAQRNIVGFRDEAKKVSGHLLDSTRLSIDDMAQVIVSNVIDRLPSEVQQPLRRTNSDPLPQHISVVVLDLEGTLFSQGEVGSEHADLAGQAVAESLEVTLPEALEAMHTTRMYLSRQAGYEVAVTAVLKELGVAPAVWSRHQRLMSSVDDLTENPAVCEAVERVQARIPVVVATNMTREPAARALSRQLRTER